MGGLNEGVISKGQGNDFDVSNLGSIRFHESDGEIHFHDDYNKLKCCIPCDTFWSRYHEWRCSGMKSMLSFLGSDGKDGLTKLDINSRYNSDTNDLDLLLYVQEVKRSNSFKLLDKLARFPH